MREFLRKARPTAAALFVSVLLVACGDDDDPADIEFNEETAGEFADAAEDVVTPMLGSVDANATIGNAMAALGAGGIALSLSPALPMELARRTAAGSLLSAREARLSVSAVAGAYAAAQGPVIPDALEGTTFVWDVESGTYVQSDEAGAPANGIRFIYYAVDPETGEPAAPLNALGYLDLVDASTASTARLELDLVRSAGNVKLVDYYVQASIVNNLETTTSTLSSDGFLGDGDERVDFDIELVRAESETVSSENADITIANEAEDAAIVLDYELEGTETSLGETGTFTIEKGADRAVFEYEFAEDDVEETSSTDGALLFNGDEVVLFSGENGDEVEYTRPDGSALTEVELEALGRMWIGYLFTILFTYSIVLPFLALVIGF